jgi:hypothetical protein
VSLFVRPDAAAEIEAAHFWYESQRPGLGDEFLDAILLVLECSWRALGVIESFTATHGGRTCADSPTACSTGSSTATLSS